MNTNDILKLLTEYMPISQEEVDVKNKIIEFINTNNDFVSRNNVTGHLTGSAWIINDSRTKVLLAHHKKADKWFQFGGHCENEEDIFTTALREATEESQLLSLKPLSYNIFDIGIYEIPTREDEPEHLHFDIGFIFVADENERFTVSNESKELAWISLGEVHKITDDKGVKRMLSKTYDIV